MGAASLGSASTAMERGCSCHTATHCWSQARPLPPVRNPLRRRSPPRALCTSRGLLEKQRSGAPDQWITPKPQHGARCQANLRNIVPPKLRPYQDAVSSTPPEMDTPAVSAGPLERKDFPNFVHFFRQASSYIKGHRDRVFVIVVPGEVILAKNLLPALLEDVTLLHGLGCKLVLVLGATNQIDNYLRIRGLEARFVGGYRVTDEVAMLAAMEAAGTSRVLVESHLSKAPAVPMVRRHTRSSDGDAFHFAPTIRVVSGNYVTGKRRGVIDGVDFCATGTVRFVQREAILQQLDLRHIVLLSNLAYSAAGEVLNCNTFDVATHAAIELQTGCLPVASMTLQEWLLQADKLFCMTLDEVLDLRLPQWLPVGDAEALVVEHLTRSAAASRMQCTTEDVCPVPNIAAQSAEANGSAPVTAAQANIQQQLARSMGEGTLNSQDEARRSVMREIELDLDCWQALDFPSAVLSALVACKNGVKRAHLVDARLDGGLLLELYTRDGFHGSTMLSSDFYEGIRPAQPQDLDAIQGLLKPLEREGIVRRRGRTELLNMLHNFTVVERENQVLACVLLADLGKAADGLRCGELAAFCVHPSYRGSGRGDSLLDYVEQTTRSRGIQRLVLLTTRSADWFEQRDFMPAGVAHESTLLPEARRQNIDPARGSKLYVKNIVELTDAAQAVPVGKRIGF